MKPFPRQLNVVQTFKHNQIDLNKWLSQFKRLTVYKTSLQVKVQKLIFYHIAVIPQYWLDLIIARSGDMYVDDSGILKLVIKCFGIVTKFRCSNFLYQKCIEVFTETKSFVNKIWNTCTFLCIIFYDLFTPRNCHLSTILQNYCDSFFLHLICNEALYSLTKHTV